MITLVNYTVRGHTLTHADVSWEVAQTNERPEDYRVSLYASEAEAGPYTPVAVDLVDRYMVRDNTTYPGMYRRTRWYKLVVRDARTSETAETPPFCRRGDLDLEGAEMARQFSLMVRRVHGARHLLLPPRTFGAKCQSCRPLASGRQLTRRCPSCWGVGIIGGYHYPVETWGTLDEAERTTQVSETQRTETTHHRFQLEGSPEVVPDALLIDRHNRRFRIIQIAPTSSYGVTIHHQGTAVLLPHTDIEYAIPVSWPEGRDLPPGVRENAHTLSGRGGARSAQSQPGGRR